jgi:hypothetical protein
LLITLSLLAVVVAAEMLTLAVVVQAVLELLQLLLCPVLLL